MLTYTLKNGEQVTAIEIGKAKIITGEKFNKLTILDRAPNTKSKKTRVICLCDCGQYTVQNLQDVKEGRVVSCGCFHKEVVAANGKASAKDYSSPENNINPFYKYIKPTTERKNANSIVWEIECRKCGKHYFDSPNELISEKRTHGNNPCNCWRKQSIGVQKIIAILKQNNIQYELEKTFPTCRSNKQALLPFDFYLPDYNILIEYDGEQHYKVCFGQTEEKLTLQKENDKIKTEWCDNNSITLIRIPYYHKNIVLNDLIPNIEVKNE